MGYAFSTFKIFAPMMLLIFHIVQNGNVVERIGAIRCQFGTLFVTINRPMIIAHFAIEAAKRPYPRFAIDAAQSRIILKRSFKHALRFLEVILALFGSQTVILTLQTISIRQR